MLDRTTTVHINTFAFSSQIDGILERSIGYCSKQWHFFSIRMLQLSLNTTWYLLRRLQDCDCCKLGDVSATLIVVTLKSLLGENEGRRT